MNYKRLAFSLIELSIVIVILGLLVGGIIAGKSLIRAAELRSVTSEFSNYQTAVLSFKAKYFAIPGDIPNAHMFWGAAAGSGRLGDGCEAGTSSGSNTCSGNGDGIIGPTDTFYSINGVNATLSGFWERFTFWQHLSNSGLIAGEYTGKTGDSHKHAAEAGLNVPPSKISAAGWDIFYKHTVGASDPVFLRTTTNMGNLLFIGRNRVVSGINREMIAPAFTPEETFILDTKMDDGILQTGKMIGINWNTCSTASAGNDRSAAYNLTNKTVGCSIAFKKLF